MGDLAQDIERFGLSELDFGEAGKLVDENGRTVCTINIKYNGLKLGEAMTYAKLFIAAAQNPDAILRALEAEGRENRLYRIMVEDCDRQRKTQYARANAVTAERDEAQHAHNHMVQMWGVSDRARMVEVDRAKTAEARLAECEARLSKAVEALREVMDAAENRDTDACHEIARATLAEMGGAA